MSSYVDEFTSVDAMGSAAPLLMCVVEELKGGMGVDEKVAIGVVIVCPSTGDVVWDDFEGGLPSSRAKVLT